MISLILATLGRLDDVDRCIASILSQQGVDFELLVIDQNPPDFFGGLRQKYPDPRIVWQNIASAGLSNARNEGIRLARHDRLALIDDDSVLHHPTHLRDALSWLERYDFVSGVCVNADGSDANRFFPIGDGAITRANLFSSIMSPCFFFRRMPGLTFDVRLGVGAAFGSAEETDFAVAMMECGGRGHFTRELSVVHPEGDGKQLSATRRYNYARGVGALMRKRGSFFGPKVMLRKLLGPLLLSARHFIGGRTLHARLAMTDFRGRVSGFLRFR